MSGGNEFHDKVRFDKSRKATITGTITNNFAGAQADQLLQLIADLRQKITEHDRELDDPEKLQALAGKLQQYLQSGEPKPKRLRALLTRMASMAGNVTAISAAVSAVRDAISA